MEIKEWMDLPELDAQVRTIEPPSEEFDEWIVEIGLYESLGEQGGDILTEFYKEKPTMHQIKESIVERLKEDKKEMNREIAMGITAKSEGEEQKERVIDRILKIKR